MPIPFQDITPQETLPWETVRGHIQDFLKFAVNQAVTGALVYKQWIYTADPYTMIGSVTAPWEPESGTSANKIHAWTIGISSAVNARNAQGNIETVGAGWTDWILTVDIWGFKVFDGTNTTQSAAEEEARRVAGLWWANSNVIVSNVPAIKQTQPIDFTSTVPQPFSNSKTAIVLAGVTQIKVREANNLV